MRLLRRSDAGDLSLTEHFVDDQIPPYAILSHRWLANTEEPTFEDLAHGIGKEKPGYEKLRFCGEQARMDGLQYFWVDTCCIDKTNVAELSQAIGSMFRWYRNANRCYVYLSDVSSPSSGSSNTSGQQQWERDLRKSDWFTRGWTLQELLAPRSVEFFSREATLLGDKSSLERQIHEITGIPKSALRRTPLSQFNLQERLSWIGNRKTQLEEDRVYSLLGIFDIYIAPFYGEGAVQAFTRLQDEIDRREKCIQHLRPTNPRDDKKRIEASKGGLLDDSYHWVLGNSDFKQWRNNEQSRLLWVRGDPGKGKTMLLCGVINELSNSTAAPDLLSYFFCQANDSRINNATAVLRGLIYLLVDQQPSLALHVQKKYDDSGKTLFEDANAWIALSEIFTNLLQDSSLNTTYLIIDALDECAVDMEKLLDFISQTSIMSPGVKWIVSSRNWYNIEERLGRAGNKVALSLELNAASISTAVGIFIQHKVTRLAEQKRYDDKTQAAVLEYLSSNASDTFLWVALVCQHLEKVQRWETLAKLSKFPPGLDSLYQRMMEQIDSLDNARLCKRILGLVAVVYRPITLKELASLLEILESLSDDLMSLLEIVSLCGSFLTVRGGTIYFVHQSAKDFLLGAAFDRIFPSGTGEVHYEIFFRSLPVMSPTLKRDIYNLRAPGYPIENVEQPEPDPLATSRYSCIYWIDHLDEWNSNSHADNITDLQDWGVIEDFLKSKYLFWLEALSLCRGMSNGVVAMGKLEALLQGRDGASALLELVRDARRFLMSHKQAIENNPLQAYDSALVFSPASSLIRALFKHEEPSWITIKPLMRKEWTDCLLTLEGHGMWVTWVAFSHDSTRLASRSLDSTVKIWDASSGDCLRTLKNHNTWGILVAFSHDFTRLASASHDGTVKIRDASSGKCLRTLKGHDGWVTSAAFSHDSTRLGSASEDCKVYIWDVSSGECLRTLKVHDGWVVSVAFSHDSTRLASASHDTTVKIWDASSSECLRTLKGHDGWVTSAAFSHDSTRLGSASDDYKVKIWDVSSGKCLRTLEGHISPVESVAFSHDSTQLASASSDHTIKIWDVSSCDCLQALEGHRGEVQSMTFSHDSTRLASASFGHMAKIGDASSSECPQALEGHRGPVWSMAFSHDSTQLASVSLDNTVKIWDTDSGECLRTLKGHGASVVWVAFSHDSTQLASASFDHTIKIWDVSSCDCLQALEGHRGQVRSVAFSHDSTQLASASLDSTVKIWDTGSGECLRTLRDHTSGAQSVAFSHDSTQLASASLDNTVRIWDTGSGECLRTLRDHTAEVQSLAFSHDSNRLASASLDSTVNIWDVSSGECLRTLQIGRKLYDISFDASGSYLLTDIGAIAVGASSISHTSNITKTRRPQYQGAGLSPGGDWITYDSEKMLWLPSEYRPDCSAVSAETVGIGVSSGKVWVCSFNVKNS